MSMVNLLLLIVNSTSNMSKNVSKFTPVVCEYNPLEDLCEVDQFGFTDLRQAFLTGTIEGTSSLDVEEYNGVDDPNSLSYSAKDIFESYRQANAVRSASLKAAKAEAEAASSAAAE